MDAKRFPAEFKREFKTLKEAFRQGLIEDAEEQPFVKMLEDRNLSTHVYDEHEAIEIFNRVRSAHMPLLRTLLSRLMKAGDSTPPPSS